MPAVADSVEQWSLRSFIVDGQFCPPGALRTWVDEWRTAHRARWAVLIPFTVGHPTLADGVVFGSLLLVTHADEAVAATAQAQLSDLASQLTAAELERAVHRVAGEAMQLSLDLILSDEVTAEFRGTRIVSTLLDALNNEGQSGLTIWHPDPLPSGEKDVRLLVVTPGTGHRVPVIPSADLEPLALMLHSTNQVVVHWHERRPRIAGEAVRRRRIDESTTRVPDVSAFHPEAALRDNPGHAYEDLFAVIHEAGLAGSRGGAALYLKDRNGAALGLTAQRGAPSALDVVDLSGRSNLALVVQRRRARVVNFAATEPAQHTAGRSWWQGTSRNPPTSPRSSCRSPAESVTTRAAWLVPWSCSGRRPPIPGLSQPVTWTTWSSWACTSPCDGPTSSSRR